MKFTLKKFNTKVSKDELIDDCIRVAKLLGKDSITQRDYLENGNYSVKTIYNKFPSWESFLNSANMSLSSNIGSKITNEELFSNLEDVWTKLGRQPKYSEMITPISKYHSSTYERRFGGWIKSLEAFVNYIEDDNEVHIDDNQVKLGHRTGKTINLRLRFKVLDRDKFKCVKCGRSPATEPHIKLQVDHIIPYSKGGETVMGNLQTLCFDCNQGKSNLFNS